MLVDGEDKLGFSKEPDAREWEQEWAITSVLSLFQTSMATSDVALLIWRTTFTGWVPWASCNSRVADTPDRSANPTARRFMAVSSVLRK